MSSWGFLRIYVCNYNYSLEVINKGHMKNLPMISGAGQVF